MIEKQIGPLPIWSFQNLSECKDILHFVSTRIGGFSNGPYQSLNLGFHVGDCCEKVLKNRKLIASNFSIPLQTFTVAQQIHEGNVALIKEEMRGKGAVKYEDGIKTTDAMVTDVAHICLMVLIADCVPILFFDKRKKVIGVAHAGWRGTVRLVAQNTVRVLIDQFNSEPEDIIVGIGPSIGPCCYEIGPEVIAEVENTFHTKEGYIDKEASNGKGYFNLWEANRKQITALGIPKENIETARICTYCHNNIFFSERYQKGKTGRFGAGIFIRK